MTPGVERMRDALRCGRAGCSCLRPTGNVHCPGHEDADPSLSLAAMDGHILWRCHAGCEQHSVRDALVERGLWPPAGETVRRNGHGSTSPRERRWPITDPDTGAVLATHVRKDLPPKDGKKHKAVWWEPRGIRATDLPLYRADALIGASVAVVCEGEPATDAAALLLAGQDDVAVVGTVTGASAVPCDAALHPLLSVETVIPWCDADRPGRGHMARVANRLLALGCPDVRILDAFPDATDGRDAADLLTAGASTADVIDLLATATRHAADAGFVGFPDRENLGNLENQAPPGDRLGFRLTALSDLLAEDAEEIAWLVADMLPGAGVSILGAKPKVGKSTTARTLAVAVSRGEDFLGRATAKGAVVYLALEEKRGEVAKHFARMGATDEPIFVHVGAAPDEALSALTAAIAENQPVLAIIDPLLKLVRIRDANDYAEVSRAMEPVIELARTSGCHLMCVHHLGKGDRTGGDAILGSTALFGAVDTALLMRRRDDRRVIESVQRYGTDLPETVVTLDAETGVVTAAGEVAAIQLEETAVKVLAELEDDELTEPEIKERVGGNPTPVAKAIRHLVETGRLLRSGRGRKGDPFAYRKPGSKCAQDSRSAGFAGSSPDGNPAILETVESVSLFGALSPMGDPPAQACVGCGVPIGSDWFGLYCASHGGRPPPPMGVP